MSNVTNKTESTDDVCDLIRPHELMWIKRKKGHMWPGFLIKIRTLESDVRLHYRFILGKPRTYVAGLKEGRFRKFKESDVLDKEQQQIPTLVAAYESGKNYLITQGNLKGKGGKAKLFTPMQYFFPRECPYRAPKKRKSELPEVHLPKSPKLETSPAQQPGTRGPNGLPTGNSNPKDSPKKSQAANTSNLKLRAKPPAAKLQHVPLWESKLIDAKVHEVKLQELKLLELKLRQAKELHEAQMRNERQFYEESRDVCEARITAIELSTMLSEEIHTIEKETALSKAQEAEIKKQIAIAKLKMAEQELKHLEAFS